MVSCDICFLTLSCIYQHTAFLVILVVDGKAGQCGARPRLHLLDDVAQPVVIDSLLKHPRRVGRQHRTGHDAAARRVLAPGGCDNDRHQDTQDDLA